MKQQHRCLVLVLATVLCTSMLKYDLAAVQVISDLGLEGLTTHKSYHPYVCVYIFLAILQ